MSTQRLVIEFIFGLLAVANFATVVRADLNVYKLYSIEWLVDTSDVIAIVRFDHEQGFANPKIVRVFKGDVDRIQFPVAIESNDHLHLHGAGKLRMLFVRGKSELLESISLGRPRDSNHLGLIRPGCDDLNAISASLYGVTQYGGLLLSESELYACVRARIGATKTDTIPWRNVYKTLDVKETYHVHHGSTPVTFPLENDHESYCLRVPMDMDRRDHFLRLLKDGDAAEKLFAITELRHFRDESAESAIRDAQHCTEVVTVYSYRSAYSDVVELNAQTVCESATRAIQYIREHP